MNMDDQLETLEEAGQTEAEQTDQESEIQDVAGDMDEAFGPDADEADQERAYDGFITESETDYNGYDPSEAQKSEDGEYDADALNSEGYHVEDAHDLEEEVIEMEIEDDDIYARIVDEDDNEIGFVLLDENGEQQEYYYVNMDEYEFVDDDDDSGTKVVRSDDGEEFDLGITREGVAEATADLNAIYRDGAAVAAELKETMSEISEEMSFLRKRR